MGPAERRRGATSVAAGAAALAAAGLGAKALSAVARILVPRWLGAETVGLYEMASPVLTTGLSLCGLGLPVALAALGAAAAGRGDRRRAAALEWASRWLLLLAGAAATLAVEAHAHALSVLLGNPRAEGALRATAPAILLASLLGGEKARLQARGRVPASAWALAVEQGVRVAAATWVAVAFARLAVFPAPQAAAALAWSPAVGAAAGLVFCLLTGARAARRSAGPGPSGPAGPGEGAALAGGAGLAGGLPSSGRPVVAPVLPVAATPEARQEAPSRALLRAGLPNWASSAVAALTTGIDVPLITWRLRAAGLGDYAGTAALGRLNGMAMPLAAGPAVLFGALGSALVPAAAADWARGDREAVRRRGRDAYFWVLASAAPAALALWQLAEPLSRLLYRTAAPAEPLTVLAVIGLPLGLSYVAAALANAVGRPAVLLPGVFAGAILKSSLVLLLTARWGIRGAALGSVAGFALSAAVSMHAVARLTGCRPPLLSWCAIGLPALLGDAGAAAGAWRVLAGVSLAMRLCGAGAAGAAAYGVVFAVGWAALRVRLALPARIPLPARLGARKGGPGAGRPAA